MYSKFLRSPGETHLYVFTWEPLSLALLPNLCDNDKNFSFLEGWDVTERLHNRDTDLDIVAILIKDLTSVHSGKNILFSCFDTVLNCKHKNVYYTKKSEEANKNLRQPRSTSLQVIQ